MFGRFSWISEAEVFFVSVFPSHTPVRSSLKKIIQATDRY